MEEKENTALDEVKKTTSAIIEKEKHFIKYVFWGLFAAVLIISIIALVKIRRLQEENIKQKITYENKIDSIFSADMSIVSETFSWAVRNDLLRGNLDQAQIHIDNLVKEPHIRNAFFVDTQTNRILLSSYDKETGAPCTDFTIINTDKTKSVKTSGNILRVFTPIMDLNKKRGVLVVEINTNK